VIRSPRPHGALHVLRLLPRPPAALNSDVSFGCRLLRRITCRLSAAFTGPSRPLEFSRQVDRLLRRLVEFIRMCRCRLDLLGRWRAVDHDSESRNTIDRALKIDQRATIEGWTTPEKVPYGDPGCREHFREGLHKAGLSE
jgi:hypothetical protein